MAWTIYNAAAYQIAWFAGILGAAHGYASAGTAIAVGVAALHLAVQRPRAGELKLIACAAAVGVAHDAVLMHLGFVDFTPAGWSEPWPPYWMVGLWVAFATTLNHSMRWFMQRPWRGIAAGVLGGPLAYLAGARLGALSLSEFAVPAIAVTFGLAMTVFLALCRRPPENRRSGRSASPLSPVHRGWSCGRSCCCRYSRCPRPFMAKVSALGRSPYRSTAGASANIDTRCETWESFRNCVVRAIRGQSPVF